MKILTLILVVISLSSCGKQGLTSISNLRGYEGIYLEPECIATGKCERREVLLAACRAEGKKTGSKFKKRKISVQKNGVMYTDTETGLYCAAGEGGMLNDNKVRVRTYIAAASYNHQDLRGMIVQRNSALFD